MNGVNVFYHKCRARWQHCRLDPLSPLRARAGSYILTFHTSKAAVKCEAIVIWLSPTTVLGLSTRLLLECYSYVLWVRGGYYKMGAYSWGGEMSIIVCMVY